MADTFSNDLRVRLQESGSNAGSWGDLLNGTITNIASGFGQGSEAIPNASTHTITLADGTADEARSLYLKCTGGGQACTVTLGPNTISKVWIIDNATSYTLTFSQGSGANVAIAAGAVKVIATDGAGSGAAVVDTLDGLEGSLSTLAVTGTATMDGLVVETSGNNYARINSTGGWSRLYLDRGVDTGRAQIIMQTSGAEDGGSWAMGLWDDETFRLQNWVGADNNTFTVSAGGDISFYNSSGTSQSLFWDSSAESLGIGTSSPRTLVNASSATGAILTLESSDTSLTTNGVIGGIDFYSNDSSTNGTGAKVNIRAIGQNSSGTATALTFGTSSSGSATAVEAMRIDASGNVGIGTAPSQKLHVYESSTSSQAYVTVQNNRSRNAAVLTQTTNGGFYTGTSIGTDSLCWQVYDASAGERMRIDASGNLLVGTTTHRGFSGGTTEITVGTTATGANSGGAVTFGSGSGFLGYLAFQESEGTLGTLTSVPLVFKTGNTERMRIDSGGNFIVGATSAFSSSSFCVDQSGLGQFRRDGTPLLVRRDGSIGDLISFEDDGASVGSIGITTSAGGTRFAIGAVGDPGIIFAGTGVFPATQITASDNVSDLGSGAYRWKNVYRAGSTYSTSDRNMKQDIRDLTDAERNVAVAAKGLLKAFRFIDRVEEEGNSANIHFGIIAQDLAVAFTAEGLDANDYQVYKAAVETDEDGNEQTRLNVCYENLLAFIIAAI